MRLETQFFTNLDMIKKKSSNKSSNEKIIACFSHMDYRFSMNFLNEVHYYIKEKEYTSIMVQSIL